MQHIGSVVCIPPPPTPQFDLRNGALRKKFDALKYTLKKLEVRMLHGHCGASLTGVMTGCCVL